MQESAVNIICTQTCMTAHGISPCHYLSRNDFKNNLWMASLLQQVIIGHVGALELAAAAIGITWCSESLEMHT